MMSEEVDSMTSLLRRIYSLESKLGNITIESGDSVEQLKMDLEGKRVGINEAEERYEYLLDQARISMLSLLIKKLGLEDPHPKRRKMVAQT